MRVLWPTILTCIMTLSAIASNEVILSTITLRVTDEQGTPIAGAAVTACCYTNHSILVGQTDNRGIFSYTDRVSGGLSCYAKASGYYETHGEIWTGPVTLTDQPPTNLTIPLKRMIKPSPLIRHRVANLIVPVRNTPVPFDFEIGDWVSPYGKGTRSDVWITADGVRAGPRVLDIKASVSFSNQFDGVQEFMAPLPYEQWLASDLIPPPAAPLTGYSNSLSLYLRMQATGLVETSSTKNRHYVFRTRSTAKQEGQVTAGNVGWIEQDIDLGLTKSNLVRMTFTYYYNPDPASRSLEPLDADNSKYR